MVDARNISKPPFTVYLNGSGQIALRREGSIMKINMQSKSLVVVEDSIQEKTQLDTSAKFKKEIYGIFGQI